MDSLTDDQRREIEDVVQFLGPAPDDKYKLAVLKLGNLHKDFKKDCERFKPGPGETSDYAGYLKRLFDLPAQNIIITIPKDQTKLDVMNGWLQINGTGLNGSRLYGRFLVLCMVRCGEKQVVKCERCKAEGCHPFEGCITIPGKKEKGCVRCMRLYYEHGKDEQYDCSFETSE